MSRYPARKNNCESIACTLPGKGFLDTLASFDMLCDAASVEIAKCYEHIKTDGSDSYPLSRTRSLEPRRSIDSFTSCTDDVWPAPNVLDAVAVCTDALGLEAGVGCFLPNTRLEVASPVSTPQTSANVVLEFSLEQSESGSAPATLTTLNDTQDRLLQRAALLCDVILAQCCDIQQIVHGGKWGAAAAVACYDCGHEHDIRGSVDERLGETEQDDKDSIAGRTNIPLRLYSFVDADVPLQVLELNLEMNCHAEAVDAVSISNSSALLHAIACCYFMHRTCVSLVYLSLNHAFHYARLSCTASVDLATDAASWLRPCLPWGLQCLVFRLQLRLTNSVLCSIRAVKRTMAGWMCFGEA